MFSIEVLREKLAESESKVDRARPATAKVGRAANRAIAVARGRIAEYTSSGKREYPTAAAPVTPSGAAAGVASSKGPKKETWQTRARARSKGNKELEAKWAAQWKAKQERRNRPSASASPSKSSSSSLADKAQQIIQKGANSNSDKGLSSREAKRQLDAVMSRINARKGA